MGVALVAASAEQAGHHVTIIDGIAEDAERLEQFSDGVYLNGLNPQTLVERIPKDTQVIGFGLMFSMNWLADRELIVLTRQHFPNAFIVAGGEHITALPEFSIQQTNYAINACVLGEGELSFVDLLDALQTGKPLTEVPGIVLNDNGALLKTTARKRETEIDKFPIPAWHLLPVQQYFRHGMVFGVDRGNCLPIVASRGCPYRCTFCSSPNMWGTRYVLRDVRLVADEMEHLKKTYGVQNVDFYDLTAIIDRQWIIDLCKELIARNLNLTWQLPSGTRSEAIDKEVAGYMYKAGCRNATYAPESGSERMLKLIKKKVKIKNLLRSAKDSVACGVNVKVNIIVGLPGETHADLWRTLWFLLRCSWVGVYDTSPGLFYPYPGSYLFKELLKAGEIERQGDAYFYHLIFTDTYTRIKSFNKNMSVRWIRFYAAMVFIVFYGSSYLFRPWRLFKNLKNIFTRRYESRLEMTFSDWLKENKLSVNKKQHVIVPRESFEHTALG